MTPKCVYVANGLPVANLISTHTSTGAPVSPSSRRTSSRTVRRVSSGSVMQACPMAIIPRSYGSKNAKKEVTSNDLCSVVISKSPNPALSNIDRSFPSSPSENIRSAISAKAGTCRPMAA
jgi:hypothetical protein